MNRNNTIGIVGRITAPVRLIVDAQEWEQKTYETTLTRTRPSGVEDTYTLQFDAAAAGTEEALETLAEGADVLIGGEIRTEDVKDPKPEENRTKIYIHAEVITQNNPPVKSQNEVSLCGYICKQAKVRTTNRRLPNGRKIKTADTIVAVAFRKSCAALCSLICSSFFTICIILLLLPVFPSRFPVFPSRFPVFPSRFSVFLLLLFLQRILHASSSYTAARTLRFFFYISVTGSVRISRRNRLFSGSRHRSQPTRSRYTVCSLSPTGYLRQRSYLPS